jgi:uncharacterized protein
MLLPLDLVAYQLVEDRVVPTWLTRDDEPFVLAVLESLDGLAELSVGEAEVVVRTNLRRIARAARMPQRIAESIWWLERKRWETIIDAPVSPEALRDVLFELAAHLPRAEALAEAARRLGLSAGPSAPGLTLEKLVAGTLFADRASRRILTPPKGRPSPADTIARFNLSTLQTLISRAMEIEGVIAGDPSAVIAAAKRSGLLGTFDGVGEGTTLRLAGPLAIFHDTAKYGRSLARFVPSLLAAPSWSLSARLDLGRQGARFEIERSAGSAGDPAVPGDPVAFPVLLPAVADGRLARRVRRVLRGVGVHVDLQPPVLRAGPSLIVTDFALEWSGGKVFVDVIPFATPEYLAAKLRVAGKLIERLLLCVDARCATIEAPAVIPYRDEVDAFALLAAARRLVGDTPRAEVG